MAGTSVHQVGLETAHTVTRPGAAPTLTTDRRCAPSPSPTALRPSQVPLTQREGARPWSNVFGTDLSAVSLHPESSRAGGRVHAVTDGDHVYFAPGRYAPGTVAGDRLIAHELAHVTQQRRAGPPSPRLAAELDADAAADAAVRGAPARPRASVATDRACLRGVGAPCTRGRLWR